MIKLTTEIDPRIVYLRASDVCSVTESNTGGSVVATCNGVSEACYRVTETPNDVTRAVEAELRHADRPT